MNTKDNCPVPLHTYSDADFAGHTTRNSIYGKVHTLNGSPIAWISLKQDIQTLSTCEAEYVAATRSVQTTTWLRRLFSFLNLLRGPTPVRIDNKAAIQVAQKTAGTKKRKFIQLRKHWLRELLGRKEITLNHVPSADQLADMLTKPLHKTKLTAMATRLNIT